MKKKKVKMLIKIILLETELLERTQVYPEINKVINEVKV